MKIFKLHRLDKVDWDEYKGFVIRAEDEISARVIAGQQDSYHKSRWIDHKQTSCEEITQEGDPGVILDSFNAG